MKKRMLTMGLIICFCLAMCLTLETTVEAKTVHWNGYVFDVLDYTCWDKGGHIDWEYEGNVFGKHIKKAAAKWNTEASAITVSRCKSIFRKDTSTTVCDVTIDDYNKNDGINAYLSTNIRWFGDMRLNRYYMNSNNMTRLTKIAVITHEFGHALGMDDSNSKKTIMYKSTPVVNGLQKIDSAALEYLMRSHTGYWG